MPHYVAHIHTEPGENINDYLADNDVSTAFEEVPDVEPDIYVLITAVRHHPDFVFGTMFTREDFPDDVVPDDFNASVIEDIITERGNGYIEDYGTGSNL